jgi:uncharacterized protein (DUF58 family)
MAKDTLALLKKVRKIEIKTRRVTNSIFSGEYHTVFKGRGMTFSEVREYQFGDEVRAIDWNVTARFNHPYVKVFEEERELTVMLLLDVSGSINFGTVVQHKQDLAAELSAVLAFSAIQNNDKVGVIFFSDQIEKYIPPKKGRNHILMIIRELIDFKPMSRGTNIGIALQYFNRIIRKKCAAFLISDFMDTSFETELKITHNKHDLVAMRLYDKHEEEFPNLGLIPIRDEETGEIQWVNTSKQKVRDAYKKQAIVRNLHLKNLFQKTGVDFMSVGTHESYVKPLMTLFKAREARR